MASTTTALTIDKGVSYAADTFVMKAKVTGSSPTGYVAFKARGTTLGSVAIDGNGEASKTVSGLAVGSYTMSAAYAGDFGNDPSDSVGVYHEVKRDLGWDGSMAKRLPHVVTHNQDTPSADWVIVHNFNGYPITDVYVMYNGDWNKIIPKTITYTDANTVTVSFSEAYAGYATVI
jgi:hypothetical protein